MLYEFKGNRVESRKVDISFCLPFCDHSFFQLYQENERKNIF